MEGWQYSKRQRHLWSRTLVLLICDTDAQDTDAQD